MLEDLDGDAILGFVIAAAVVASVFGINFLLKSAGFG
jgi:hypothetical protein